jgi:hypothetical protein
METNILKAILNIKNFKNKNLKEIYSSNTNITNNNRINSEGLRLEFFIKDSFANSFDVSNKEFKHSEIFSWLGNKNNPPDTIIKNGDAIEVKKIENRPNTIALNSSYPKSKIRADDSRITKECKEIIQTEGEKDIIYAIGIVKKSFITNLFFVYGDVYAAEHHVHEKISEIIRDSVIDSDLELSKTNELARINRIDPLGITYLRVRGMWGIEHPVNVFKYILPEFDENKFSLISLMKQEKYESFPEKDRINLETDKKIIIKKLKVKDPNNPAKLINSVLIIYEE